MEHTPSDDVLDPGPERALTTVTHARIRAQQGDLARARSILQAILEDEPEHAEACALLEALAGPAPGRIKVSDRAPTSRGEIVSDPGHPEIVVDRLSRWLDRIKANSEQGGA